MADPLINVSDVPQAIQLALGPVFLLTATAGLLNVLTGRLARIIDRARFLTEQPEASQVLPAASIESELTTLEQRRRWTSMAITSCTFAALFACMVILVLFLESVLSVPLKGIAGGLFVTSTLSLVVGLAYFLREVLRASRSVRIAVVSRSRGDEKT